MTLTTGGMHTSREKGQGKGKVSKHEMVGLSEARLRAREYPVWLQLRGWSWQEESPEKHVELGKDSGIF